MISHFNSPHDLMGLMMSSLFNIVMVFPISLELLANFFQR